MYFKLLFIFIITIKTFVSALPHKSVKSHKNYHQNNNNHCNDEEPFSKNAGDFIDADELKQHKAFHYKDDDHSLDRHFVPSDYKYEYAVNDLHKNDNKEAWETRNGDVVKGSYSLIESDGTKRIVEYTADKHNGFSAIVTKIGPHKTEVEYWGNFDH